MTTLAITRTFPLHTVSEANARDGWRARARRAKEHRGVVAMVLRPMLSGWRVGTRQIEVTFVRVSAGKLDDDNLRSAIKGTRDGVSDALGIDDGDPRVQFFYEQERCSPKSYAVIVTIKLLSNKRTA